MQYNFKVSISPGVRDPVDDDPDGIGRRLREVALQCEEAALGDEAVGQGEGAHPEAAVERPGRGEMGQHMRAEPADRDHDEDQLPRQLRDGGWDERIGAHMRPAARAFFSASETWVASHCSA